MKINVNEKILRDAIESLKNNNKFFVIDNNLFSIENIDTMLKVKTCNDTYNTGLYDRSAFMFTYNRPFIKNEYINCIKLVYTHEEDTCISFVKLCKFISDDEINAILKKSSSISLEKSNFMKGMTKLPCLREDDEIFYNEVLVYISSKINENDKSLTTDDFTSKFELYKEKQQAKNQETIKLMNELYEALLKIKLENK